MIQSLWQHIAIDQIIDHQMPLCYLGVPIGEKTFMFGNNKPVVDGFMTPHAQLHKRHTSLAFHQVMEAVASKTGNFILIHIDSKINPADMLSKHWGYQKVWPMLKPLLFYEGDTMDILDETTVPTNKE